MDDAPHIYCTIAHNPWRQAKAPATLVRKAVRAALAVARAEGVNGEISIVLSSDSEIRQLNATWRGKDTPTNVLSFAAHDASGQHPCPQGSDALGDIILAFETCRREARTEGKPLEHHMAHLVVHGVLHLLGHDHMRSAEAETMMALEIRALAMMGIPDPYNIHSKES
ncbi:MAG TPA: rRNA maturation RNase YbeY [Rhodospirillaceae bacterium]|nr:MAG: rRNA maturation RNase YbeY [Alphaproteobacteria bacterium GWF2_58_20]HAU29271.1 rRNA maturation RNase YbeY [Rhodospirillaceae bacterium]